MTSKFAYIPDAELYSKNISKVYYIYKLVTSCGGEKSEWMQMSFLGEFDTRDKAKSALSEYLSFDENISAEPEDYAIIAYTVSAECEETIKIHPKPDIFF